MNKLSFELHPDMLEQIDKQYSPEKIADKFCQEISGKPQNELDEIGKSIFYEYGSGLMKTALQLGEQYSDRTYEVLREAADRSGSLTFPLVPQRFIEIAYLSILNISVLPIVENNSRRFIFNVENCPIYRHINEKCGKNVADSLLCQHGCMEACRLAFEGFFNAGELGYDMIANTPKEGYCSFQVSRYGGKFPWATHAVTYTYEPKKKKKKANQ